MKNISLETIVKTFALHGDKKQRALIRRLRQGGKRAFIRVRDIARGPYPASVQRWAAEALGVFPAQVALPSVRHLLISGDNAALEVDTRHVFKGGVVMRFDQMFMIETRAGKITRLQAYVPYTPPGLAGLAPRLTRWVWRLQGLR